MWRTGERRTAVAHGSTTYRGSAYTSRAGSESASGSSERSRIWPRAAGRVTVLRRWSRARVWYASAWLTCNTDNRTTIVAMASAIPARRATSRRTGGRFTAHRPPRAIRCAAGDPAGPPPRPGPPVLRAARGGIGCRRGDACRGAWPRRRSGRGRTGWPARARARGDPARGRPCAAPGRPPETSSERAGRSTRRGRGSSTRPRPWTGRGSQRFRAGAEPESRGATRREFRQRAGLRMAGARPRAEVRPDGIAPGLVERPGATDAGAAWPARSRGLPYPLGSAQARAPRSRVACDLLGGGAKRLVGELDQSLVRREAPLDDAILERVVGDDDDAATGSEKPDRSRQGSGELLQLPVDRDAERLERPTRGVGAAPPPSNGARDHARELVRRLDPPARARTHDGGRHPPRPPLLSVLEQDPRELVLRRGVHEVRGALRLRVHPHVERTRLPEAEAALRPLELHRRDAKVVEEAVGPALHGHLREPGADPDEPRSEPRQASGGSLEGLRVAVDPDQA